MHTRNWAFGSAMALTLVFTMLIVVTLNMRLLRRTGAARDDVDPL